MGVCELHYLSRALADTKSVVVYSPEKGVLADRIKAEYNEQGPRVPLKDLYGHQMMLVSDMVLKWDPGFRKYMDIYYEDEDRLRDDLARHSRNSPKTVVLGQPRPLLSSEISSQ